MKHRKQRARLVCASLSFLILNCVEILSVSRRVFLILRARNILFYKNILFLMVKVSRSEETEILAPRDAVRICDR